MSKQEVDAWFADYDLPQKTLMQAVRAVMLEADLAGKREELERLVRAWCD